MPPGSTPVAPAAPVDEEEDAGPEVQTPVAEAEPEPEGPPPLPDPIETRRSTATLAVYDATERTRDHLRGQIPRHTPFHVYAHREGPNCRGGEWGQVGREAWVCLNKTDVTDKEPVILPVLGDGQLVPYLYARPRREYRSSGESIPRWSNRQSYNAGDPPLDELPAHGQYAFRRRRHNGGETVYEDPKRRVVPAEYLWGFAPSEFAGRVLVDAPVPDNLGLAWVIERDGAPLLASADRKAKEVGKLDYHAQVHVRPGTSHADDWVEVLDTDGQTRGWTRNDSLGLWAAPPALPGVGPNEVWIDVELDEQVLTVMRGTEPVFATLVSSGKPGHRTPPGTFRVNRKKAYGAMQSQEDDPEPYYVEAVPWSQYYYQGFAIHASYWHDGFGKRRSHGCVNLSPRDARHVFELTGPHLEPGWVVAYEHAVDPGTTIQVRRGEDRGTDHREPIAPPADDDDDVDE